MRLFQQAPTGWVMGGNAAAYLPVGGGASAGAQSQEGLEGGHGFASPVVAEHELVEVDRKQCAADSMVRSYEPVLKVAGCPIRERDDGLGALSQVKRWRLGSRPMPVPGLLQSREALQAIGVDGGTGRDVTGGELPDRRRVEIENDLHPDSPCRSPTPLHGDEHQRGLASLQLSASSESRLGADHPRLVKFDFAPEGLPRLVDHRSTTFVENQPSGLIAFNPELALEQKGRETSLVRRHQVGGPEPRREWRLRVVKNGPRCQGNLVPTGSALPPTPADQHVTQNLQPLPRQRNVRYGRLADC